MAEHHTTIRVRLLAERGGRSIEQVQQSIRDQERDGVLRIIHMDDDEAEVAFFGQFGEFLAGGDDA